MRKLIVAIATLACAGNTYAGDYHISTTLRCSQCHTMHASRQHAFNAGTEDAEYPIADQGFPNRKLLIKDGTNETCLACHDGQTNFPDVLGANLPASAARFSTANARSAGALNGTVGAHTPGTASDAGATAYADWMGHTLASGNAPPGWVGIYDPGAEALNCSNCHAVHGSAAYRNLGLSIYMGTEGNVANPANPFGNAGPTYNALPFGGARATLLNDGSADVTIGAAARDYRTAQVTFGVGSANTSAVNGMNAYCAVCHGDFHGAANTVDPVFGLDFVRHPTSGVARTNAGFTGIYNYGLAADQSALVRPAWRAAPAAGAEFEVACLTCHKGHGNARAFGLLFPSNTAAPVDFEQGDAAIQDLGDGSGAQYPIRQLCITCHPMGR